MQSPPVLSRRALLRAAMGLAGAAVAAGALAGCEGLGGDGAPDDANPLLDFLTATVQLADRYDGAITAVPALSAALTPIRDAHRAHATALAAALEVPAPAPSGTNPTDPTTAKAALVDAEKVGRDAAAAACLAASAAFAPLVGSIAAARATHLEVLT